MIGKKSFRSQKFVDIFSHCEERVPQQLADNMSPREIVSGIELTCVKRLFRAGGS